LKPKEKENISRNMAVILNHSQYAELYAKTKVFEISCQFSSLGFHFKNKSKCLKKSDAKPKS
jgi:hypothetical protein